MSGASSGVAVRVPHSYELEDVIFERFNSFISHRNFSITSEGKKESEGTDAGLL